MFSSFLVRNSFICCSLQNSLSTDHGCWSNSPFPHYCLLAFTFLNGVRTFSANFIFSDECLEYSNVPVSWDVLSVFLMALEFYSPSTLAHTPPGNNQQKARDHLEIRQRTHISWRNREEIYLLAPLAYLTDQSDLLISILCSSTIFPFSSHRISFQQCQIFPTSECERLSEGKGLMSSKSSPSTSGHWMLCSNKHPVFRNFSFLVTWDNMILVSFSAFAVFDYLCEKCRKRFFCINYSRFQFINQVFTPCLNGYCSLKQYWHAQSHKWMEIL